MTRNGLLVERNGDVTTLCLSRPDKLNALDAALVEALAGAMDAAAGDGTRLVVLRGAGKGFSGGFDFSDLERQSEGDLVLRFVRLELLLQAITHAPVMTLALAHGPCFGAAADIVASCTRRVAAPDARFRMPGLRFGVVLGTRRLARLIGADAARELLLTSKVFGAAEAQAHGFVGEVLAADQWDGCIARTAAAARELPAASARTLLGITTDDSRDQDLAALARSVAEPGLKDRIAAYLKAMKG